MEHKISYVLMMTGETRGNQPVVISNSMSNWINISYFRKGRVGKFIIPCHSRSRNLLKESVTSCQLVSYKSQLCSYFENHDRCWWILNFPS